MKKVISFSLWGNDRKYTIGAIENAKLAKEHYPGWTCRYYIGKSVPEDITEQLKKFENTEKSIFVNNVKNEDSLLPATQKYQ